MNKIAVVATLYENIEKLYIVLFSMEKIPIIDSFSI